jgi:5-methylcytosine-specific restriction endonuclease McrA
MTTTEKTVGKAGRNSLPKPSQVKVFYRDHWLCRWCKRPVIFAPAMKYLQQHLSDAGYKDLAYWRYAYDRHGAPLLDDLAAVLDHVTAFSVGGPGNAENLVTACNKCNTRKNNSDAAAWERAHPVKAIKGKHGEPVDWDGFSSLFLFFAGKYAANLTKSEKAWVKALKNERLTAQT